MLKFLGLFLAQISVFCAVFPISASDRFRQLPWNSATEYIPHPR